MRALRWCSVPGSWGTLGIRRSCTAVDPPPLSKNQQRRLARFARKNANRRVPHLWPHVKSLGKPKRYCAIVSWDGSQYHGWQKQHPAGAVAPLRTIQGLLEDTTCRALEQQVRVNASGRCAAAAAAAC